MNKKSFSIFKWIMLAMIIVSVAILVLGFALGFEANDGKFTDILLTWAYIVLGIAVLAWVLVGAIVAFKNNPKSLIKIGIGLVAIAAVVFLVYLISPGAPAMNMSKQPEQGILKLTDTILNLCYVTGGIAILSIIAGEVVMAIRNKKA